MLTFDDALEAMAVKLWTLYGKHLGKHPANQDEDCFKQTVKSVIRVQFEQGVLMISPHSPQTRHTEGPDVPVVRLGPGGDFVRDIMPEDLR